MKMKQIRSIQTKQGVESIEAVQIRQLTKAGKLISKPNGRLLIRSDWFCTAIPAIPKRDTKNAQE